MASVINNTSGGIGKKDASENANKKSAMLLYCVSAQLNTQSYNFLIEVNNLLDNYNFSKKLDCCHRW